MILICIYFEICKAIFGPDHTEKVRGDILAPIYMFGVFGTFVASSAIYYVTGESVFAWVSGILVTDTLYMVASCE